MAYNAKDQHGTVSEKDGDTLRSFLRCNQEAPSGSPTLLVARISYDTVRTSELTSHSLNAGWVIFRETPAFLHAQKTSHKFQKKKLIFFFWSGTHYSLTLIPINHHKIIP